MDACQEQPNRARQRQDPGRARVQGAHLALPNLPIDAALLRGRREDIFPLEIYRVGLSCRRSASTSALTTAHLLAILRDRAQSGVKNFDEEISILTESSASGS